MSVDYKNLWTELKSKLNYANEDAHPRFKMMGENPTIQIIRVLEIMKELEEMKEKVK